MPENLRFTPLSERDLGIPKSELLQPQGVQELRRSFVENIQRGDAMDFELHFGHVLQLHAVGELKEGSDYRNRLVKGARNPRYLEEMTLWVEDCAQALEQPEDIFSLEEKKPILQLMQELEQVSKICGINKAPQFSNDELNPDGRKEIVDTWQNVWPGVQAIFDKHLRPQSPAAAAGAAAPARIPASRAEPATAAPNAPGDLTDEAKDLLEKIQQGGVPAFTTNNLLRIARENGITPAQYQGKTRNEIIDLLQARTKASEPPSAPAATPEQQSAISTPLKGKELLGYSSEARTKAARLTGAELAELPAITVLALIEQKKLKAGQLLKIDPQNEAQKAIYQKTRTIVSSLVRDHIERPKVTRSDRVSELMVEMRREGIDEQNLADVAVVIAKMLIETAGKYRKNLSNEYLDRFSFFNLKDDIKSGRIRSLLGIGESDEVRLDKQAFDIQHRLFEAILHQIVDDSDSKLLVEAAQKAYQTAEERAFRRPAAPPSVAAGEPYDPAATVIRAVRPAPPEAPGATVPSTPEAHPGEPARPFIDRRGDMTLDKIEQLPDDPNAAERLTQIFRLHQKNRSSKTFDECAMEICSGLSAAEIEQIIIQATKGEITALKRNRQPLEMKFGEATQILQGQPQGERLIVNALIPLYRKKLAAEAQAAAPDAPRSFADYTAEERAQFFSEQSMRDLARSKVNGYLTIQDLEIIAGRDPVRFLALASSGTVSIKEMIIIMPELLNQDPQISEFMSAMDSVPISPDDQYGTINKNVQSALSEVLSSLKEKGEGLTRLQLLQRILSTRFKACEEARQLFPEQLSHDSMLEATESQIEKLREINPGELGEIRKTLYLAYQLSSVCATGDNGLFETEVA